MPNPTTALNIENGRIHIPACTTEWANIAVRVERAARSTGFHTVAIPDLVVTDKAPVCYNEMPTAEYTRILQENRAAILLKVAELNRRIHYAGNTLVIDDGRHRD